MPLEHLSIFLAESGSSGDWLLALTIALALFFVFRLWSRRRPVPSEPAGEADAAMRIRQAADKALIELAEVGREVSGRIDTKVRILNRLTKEAEAQIKRLEQLLQAAGREVPPAGEEAKSSSASVPRAAGDDIHSAARKLHERVLQLSREGKTPAEIARLTRLAIQEIDLVLRLAAERARSR